MIRSAQSRKSGMNPVPFKRHEFGLAHSMIERLTEWSADAVAQIIGAVQLFSPKYMLGALLGCVLNACSLLGRGIVRMIFPPRTTPQPPAIAAAEALLPRLLVQSSSSAGPNRWLLTAAIRWAPSLWSFARDARTRNVTSFVIRIIMGHPRLQSGK